jgi:FKBP-type peptidyl-prolyl cis-trans isomerase (trigger factor)
MLHEIEDNLAHQGSKMADYLQHLGKTKDQFVLDLVPSALKRVKTALIMKEIGVIEKLDVSSQEISDKIAELKETHKGDKSLDELEKNPAYLRYLGNVLQNEKVLNKLKEWNYADSGKKQKS